LKNSTQRIDNQQLNDGLVKSLGEELAQRLAQQLPQQLAQQLPQQLPQNPSQSNVFSVVSDDNLEKKFKLYLLLKNSTQRIDNQQLNDGLFKSLGKEIEQQLPQQLPQNLSQKVSQSNVSSVVSDDNLENKFKLYLLLKNSTQKSNVSNSKVIPLLKIGLQDGLQKGLENVLNTQPYKSNSTDTLQLKDQISSTENNQSKDNTYLIRKFKLFLLLKNSVANNGTFETNKTIDDKIKTSYPNVEQDGQTKTPSKEGTMSVKITYPGQPVINKTLSIDGNLNDIIQVTG
jgi:hypothetical protein